VLCPCHYPSLVWTCSWHQQVTARRRNRESGRRTLLNTDVADASEPTSTDAADNADRRISIPYEDDGNQFVKPSKKTREVYDIDDDYWGAIYNEPKIEKPKKKSKKTLEEPAPLPPFPSPQPSPTPTPTPSPIPSPTPEPLPTPPIPSEPTPTAESVLSMQMPPYTGYDISARQISQDVLPQAPNTPNPLPGCPAFFKQTEVLAYGPANVPGTPFHNWPAYTIEAQVRRCCIVAHVGVRVCGETGFPCSFGACPLSPSHEHPVHNMHTWARNLHTCRVHTCPVQHNTLQEAIV